MSTKHLVRRTDTGIDWIGAIPCGWVLQPLKHLAEFFNGMAFKPSDWTHTGTPIIRIANLNGSSDFNYYADSVPNRYHVGRGDLLFGWSGNRGTSFGPFLWQHEGNYFLNQHIFKIKEKDCSRAWLYWCLKAVTGYVEQEAHGIIGMVHVTKGKLGGVNVPVPSDAEQIAIADFLDRETAKIDALIEKQAEFLALLDEHRRALTVEAITHGLNSRTPTQESGIGWIGQVPAHWMLPRVGKYFEVQLGKMLDGSRQTGQHLAPYLRVFDIQWGIINIEELPTMDFSAGDRVRFALNPGDLLVNEGGSYVGRSAIWNGDLAECYYQKALHRVRPRTSGDSNRFLYYFMFAAVKLGVFVAGGNQTTIDHLTAEQFRSYRFPRPPLVEQIAIADYLDNVHSRTELASLRSKEMIERLRERRAALITAAVTGQIDVTEPALTEAAA